MFTVINARFRKFKYLWAYKFFLKFYYGQRLRDFPLPVAAKMILSRVAFLSLIPFFLPDRHFLMKYYGAKMYIDLFEAPIAFDRAFGVYEYWTTRLFRNIVKEGMTIVDIGAHQGTYSVLFASLMNDKGRVFAFEPDPANYSWIMKNVQANSYQCIETYPLALSDNDGEATFHVAGGMGSLYPNAGAKALSKGTITVRTRKLDNFLQEKNISDVDIIKMDVEGADLMVLKGAEETLRSMELSLLMDVDVYLNSERKELFDLLKSCGFEIYRIGKELEPIEKAAQLFLFDDNQKPIHKKTHLIVREIYATKSHSL